MEKRRNTLQRDIILKALADFHGHYTGDEIYRTVTEKYPSISRGTVYRNLKILVESGKVEHIVMPGGADLYEFTETPHYHIRCTVCGCLSDAAIAPRKSLDEDAQAAETARKTGFIIGGHSLIFQGVCPACQQGEADSDFGNCIGKP